MKQIRTIILFFFSLCALEMVAQPEGPRDGERSERIERLKRAFISERLDLTVAEAEKFWPMYNEYQDRKHAVRDAMREARRSTERSGVGEKALVEASLAITQRRKEEADIDHQFLLDVMPVLGAEKTAKLIGMEEEFRRVLMDKLRERRSEGGRNGGRPDGPGPRRIP